MISALLMLRRLAAALRVALRDEDFGRVLSAGLLLIITGTLAYSLGAGWSIVDGLYVAVATLTTSSILYRNSRSPIPGSRSSRPATCSSAPDGPAGSFTRAIM